jgi:hypothetical protein
MSQAANSYIAMFASEARVLNIRGGRPGDPNSRPCVHPASHLARTCSQVNVRCRRRSAGVRHCRPFSQSENFQQPNISDILTSTGWISFRSCYLSWRWQRRMEVAKIGGQGNLRGSAEVSGCRRSEATGLGDRVIVACPAIGQDRCRRHPCSALTIPQGSTDNSGPIRSRLVEEPNVWVAILAEHH